MVDRKDPLPVTRQCALLDLPRSTFYHEPTPVSDEELDLKYPFLWQSTPARLARGPGLSREPQEGSATDA